MKKFLTYRNAGILGWIGFAMVVASWFTPSHSWQDLLLSSFGIILSIVGLAASYHQEGRGKGFSEGYAAGRVQVGVIDIGSGVYKVNDFGAVGDGATDDTAAFQNEFNAARTWGKR